MAVKYGISAELIGETAPERMEIKLDGRVVVSAAVSELRDVYESALEKALRTEPDSGGGGLRKLPSFARPDRRGRLSPREQWWIELRAES